MPDNADTLTLIPSPSIDGVVPTPENPADVVLAPEVKLVGHDGLTGMLNPVKPVWLPLYWQAIKAPADYVVQLRLVDSDGSVATQWQGRPAYGTYPMHKWRSGEVVRDVWALQTPSEVPPGSYNLDISLLSTWGEQPLPTPETLLLDAEVAPQPVSFDIPSMQNRVELSFGDRFTMLGYDMFFDSTGSDVVSGNLSPVFYWLSQANMTGEYEIHLFLQSINSDEKVGEWHLPLGNNASKSTWEKGEVVATSYFLPVHDLPEDTLDLEIGLWSVNDEAYLRVPDRNGEGSDRLRLERINEKITVRLNSK
jgi:hypothetical protein